MSLLTVILLLICTCTYIRSIVPSLVDNRLGKVGFIFYAIILPCIMYYVVVYIILQMKYVYGPSKKGTCWKCARIGERKSPYVAVGCLLMAFSILFWT